MKVNRSESLGSCDIVFHVRAYRPSGFSGTVAAFQSRRGNRMFGITDAGTVATQHADKALHRCQARGFGHLAPVIQALAHDSVFTHGAVNG